MFGKKKDDKNPKKGHGKKPVIPKKDQNGDAIKKAPKGVDKVVRTNQGNIIMVSSLTGFSDKPKKTVKPAAKPAAPKKAVTETKSSRQAKKELAGEVYDLLMRKYPEKPAGLSSRASFIKTNVDGMGKNVKPTSKADLERYKKELQAELGISSAQKSVTPKAPTEPKKPATPKTATAKKPAANRESNRLDSKPKTTSAKKPAQPKLPKELRMTSKEHDDYEKGITGEPLLPLGLKPKTKKELRHAVKGGFTVWDGLQRTGKTFETKQEADDYADDFYKKTGIKVSVTSTRRNVTHTFRPEQQRKK